MVHENDPMRKENIAGKDPGTDAKDNALWAIQAARSIAGNPPMLKRSEVTLERALTNTPTITEASSIHELTPGVEAVEFNIATNTQGVVKRTA